MVNWKKNLIIIWFSQFLSISGFSFSIPFVPFYMQTLGVTNPDELKVWISLFSAATPLTLAFFSPIWGAVADRHGRKLMLLRANFAGSVVIGAMGLVSNVHMLIVLRALQGMLTGTITASQTLVSVYTPKDRNGFALGLLSAAVFSGTMIGAFLGGFFAEFFGYRISFGISGAMLLLGGILVYIGVEENFIPETNIPKRVNQKRIVHLFGNFGPGFFILLLIAVIAFVRQFDQPFIPLVIQNIIGSTKGASFKTGILSGASGVAGFLSALVIGKLADRFSPPKLAILSAIFSAVLLIPQGVTNSFILLLVCRFFMIFFAGGLEPVFQIWLAKITPASQRGIVFGWAGTARSIGWFISPLVAGAVTTLFSVHAVFFFGAAFYILITILIVCVVPRIQKRDFL